MHGGSALAAPFPYFGGKRLIASEVWRRFGRVNRYVEPFAGSAAVLLARPGGAHGYEVLNDKDCFVANFWRATQADPDAVAVWCDWPSNEIDMRARNRWLITSPASAAFKERLRDDPDYHDPKIAGWWAWGMSIWMGPGWSKCDYVNIPELRGDRGIQAIPDLPAAFARLRARLRRVNVCCGEWRRVCNTEAILTSQTPVAVFLDPPYGHAADRRQNLYTHDDPSVAHEVMAWCREFGPHPDVRIALCGLEGEHNELEAAGWQVWAWSSRGGLNPGGDPSEKRHLERVWFSPACDWEPTLFD